MTNKSLQFLIADKSELKLYKPVSSYITYDCETMNITHVDNANAKATKIEMNSHLLSFVLAVVINNKVTNIFSYFRVIMRVKKQ
jgi:hypothetical protein